MLEGVVSLSEVVTIAQAKNTERRSRNENGVKGIIRRVGSTLLGREHDNKRSVGLLYIYMWM